jgi:hypothetical protein
VVVISAEEFERLHRLDQARAPSFSELLLAIPQGGEPFRRAKVRPRDVDF